MGSFAVQYVYRFLNHPSELFLLPKTSHICCKSRLHFWIKLRVMELLVPTVPGAASGFENVWLFIYAENKAVPTPSAYSAHVFVRKHVNKPSQIYCSRPRRNNEDSIFWGGRGLEPHFDTVKPACFE